LSLLVFSHGNSFPAATYGVLFKHLRARGFKVKAIDKFGHDPRFPVTNNWPHLVTQLSEFAEREAVEAGEPAYLVGHSLGGFLSVMCAARQPEVTRGVVMLDSPLLGGWKATAVSAAKRTTMIGAVSPGAVSRHRRERWPSVQAALEHFQHKKAFARWDPQVLYDYVTHCTQEAEGQRVLSFDRAVETAIYNTLPHNIDRLLQRHPLKCPAAFIGGIQSVELKQVGLALTEKATHGRITLMEGTHLFPMEKPAATAAAIEAALLAF
jgi:pimeloyl-ACP methyl ester carboxylesterase